jgi:hypothetical protein
MSSIFSVVSAASQRSTVSVMIDAMSWRYLSTRNTAASVTQPSTRR